MNLVVSMLLTLFPLCLITGNNSLTDEIPKEIGNLDILEVINLVRIGIAHLISYMKQINEYHALLNKCDSIFYLSYFIANNLVEGVIPTEIGNLEVLDIIDLVRNMIEFESQILSE